MKKIPAKITVFLFYVFLSGFIIYVLRNSGLKTEEELGFPPNSEVIVEENIDPVCDSIKILSTDAVKANEKLKMLGQTDYRDDSAVCKVGIQTYVVLDDLALSLFPTFYDPDMALKLIKNKCGIVIHELKTTYGLEDLSDENWKEYRKCLYVRFEDEDKPDWYEETNEQIGDLSYFFLTYETLSRNNYLVSLAASAHSIQELLSNKDFLSNLSYYVLDDLVEENMIERTKEIGGEYRVVPDRLKRK